MENSIIKEKVEFRKKQFIIRKKIYLNNKIFFNEYILEKFFKKINIESIEVVSSFMSINTEIHTMELNNYILKNNKTLCLPVILKKNDYMIFRKFSNDKDMVEGFMRIKEPIKTNEILVPDLIFVPCLAYDELGFRLGYGGGYYDRTLSHLKKNKKKFITVGYAFDDQKVSEVPKDKFDIKLDYVITEKNLYTFI